MKVLLLITLSLTSLESLAKRNELPFHEPVRLAKVSMKTSLPTNFLSSYKGINIEGKKTIERKVAER